MNPLPDRTPATPRWATQALLGAAVLAAHLMLLVGDLAIPFSRQPPSPAAPSAVAPIAAGSATDTAVPPPPAQPPRANISTVRWIVATAPPPTALPTPSPTRANPAKPPETQPKTERSAPLAPREPAPPIAPIAPAKFVESVEVAETTTRESTRAERDNALDPPASPLLSPPPSDALVDAPPTLAPTAPPATIEANAGTSTASPPQPPPAPPERSEPRPPAQPPASTQLAYGVTGNIKGINYSARSTLEWTHADGQYRARMEVRIPLLGSRVQTSTGQVEASGLRPDRFSDKSRSERAAHFDHAQQNIRFSNNRPDAALEPGAQDRLSLFMQLAGLLNARPAAYPAGQTISLQVAGTSDAEIWRFRVEEEAMLELPAGVLRARRLVREPRQPRDSLIDIWLAPDLAYLPVRIRITQDNGDRIDQQLSQMP